MSKYTNKSDKVENELFEIAGEITALGDMIPNLFLNIEEMEPETPIGIKTLLMDVRKRIEPQPSLLKKGESSPLDDLRKYVGGK